MSTARRAALFHTLCHWLACGLLALTAMANSARAENEYSVKAAFLVRFTRFVEWPQTAFATEISPITICVVGEDPSGIALDQMADEETVNARRMTVQRMHQFPAPGLCHVLFVARSEKDVSKGLSETGPGVLTVGEGDMFLREGGMITFVLENRRVRFDINQAAAARADLKMNAKLLSVARSVEK